MGWCVFCALLVQAIIYCAVVYRAISCCGTDQDVRCCSHGTLQGCTCTFTAVPLDILDVLPSRRYSACWTAIATALLQIKTYSALLRGQWHMSAAYPSVDTAVSWRKLYLCILKNPTLMTVRTRAWRDAHFSRNTPQLYLSVTMRKLPRSSIQASALRAPGLRVSPNAAHTPVRLSSALAPVVKEASPRPLVGSFALTVRVCHAVAANAPRTWGKRADSIVCSNRARGDELRSVFQKYCMFEISRTKSDGRHI
eukprot:IDg19427t1